MLSSRRPPRFLSFEENSTSLKAPVEVWKRALREIFTNNTIFSLLGDILLVYTYDMCIANINKSERGPWRLCLADLWLNQMPSRNLRFATKPRRRLELKVKNCKGIEKIWLIIIERVDWTWSSSQTQNRVVSKTTCRIC